MHTTEKNSEHLEHIRHSLAHLLAAAVLELYPDTKNTIGPAIENGFYYDFEFTTPITEKELPKIENKMLTRVYGLAFKTKEELDAYIKQIEEAEKRDHKKLGKELGLFTFSPLVGPGLPLWTPKGTIIREILNDYVWELRKAKGYQK